MRSEIQAPAEKEREDKSVHFCAHEGEGHPSHGTYAFLTRVMCTGSLGEGRLRRKKSYLLSLRLSKMSSVFKSISFPE